VTYAIATLIAVCAVQSWLLWRLTLALGQMTRFEERLSGVTQGLSILVDTSEAGFAMLGHEMGKATAESTRPRSSRSTTRRVTSAAARGREIWDIAAEQELSEGEVRLRMHLATADATSSAVPEGDRRGTVRS
jgi:hypothetical protein